MVPVGLVLKMVIGRSDQFIKIKEDLNKTKKKKKNAELNQEQIEALSFLEKVNKNLMYQFCKVQLGRVKL